MSAHARIDAIDFWRGFALLTIFADHMPYSVLAHVTHRNFGLSDAAEAFVFLSGMSAALAYGPQFDNGRIAAGLRAVGRRLLTLYGVQILLSLLAFGIVAMVALMVDDDVMEDEDRLCAVESGARRPCYPRSCPSDRLFKHPAALHRASVRGPRPHHASALG